MGDLEALIEEHPEEPQPLQPLQPPQPADHPPPDGVAQDNRPNIDNMIQQLQREQDQRIAREGRDPLASPPPQLGSPRVNRSSSGKPYIDWL